MGGGMSPKNEQENQLVQALHATINRFRAEYDLNYAQTIGCIELVKLDIYGECREIQEEDEE
jgi:hypothetical protein